MTATTATHTLTAVVWTRGPLDKPELCREQLNLFATDAKAAAFEVGIAGERLIASAQVTRTLTVGEDVVVQAFGRMRAGVVQSFRNSRVVVSFVRNLNLDIETRSFRAEDVYPAEGPAEAAIVAEVKAADAPAPVVEPELAAGLGTLTAQLNAYVLVGELTADTRVTVRHYHSGPATVPAGTRVALIPAGSAGVVNVAAAKGETYAGGGIYGSAVLADLPFLPDTAPGRYPSRLEVGRMTDGQLAARRELLEQDVAAAERAGDEARTEHALEALGHVEAEEDARELWNSPDGRVRESVGNYRP